jgi:glycosyltransferase involved in cell wall biosynthesis
VRIVHLTAGAGGWFCGTCIRDNALVRGLRARGHEVNLVPLYLPITSEGASCSADATVLMSGVNVWLQHTSAVFRSLPSWVDAPLAARPLLEIVGRNAGSTRPDELGALTMSMLEGEEGPIRKEVDRLVQHLAGQAPDVIVLSNSLLAGLVPALRRRLGVPVVVNVQGELHFIDAMGDYAPAVWRALSARLAEADGRLAVSRFAAEAMAVRTGIARSKFAVAHNGVDPERFGPHVEPPTPTLTFFARLIEKKGLHEAVELFISLAERHPTLTLTLAGTLQPGDRPGVERATARLREAGLSDRVTVEGGVSPERKVSLMANTTVFCVPTQKDETFGMYHVEAMASGAPIVALGRGAVPEVVDGAAVIVPPGDREALVAAVDTLLTDPARRAALGAVARQRAVERFSEQRMAAETEAALRRVVEG